MRFFILLLPVCFWGLRGADFTAAPSKGEKLAKQYCSGCHLYTPPTLFERAHWEKNILPRMALFMGLYPNDSTKAIYYGKAVVFPDKPMLTQSDFEAIRDFYLTKAPEKTMPSVAQAIGDTLPGFKVRIPDARIVPPGSSMARFGLNGAIYIGDVYAQKLFEFDATDLRLLRSGRVAEGIVDIDTIGSDLLLTVMGSFAPTDAPSGALLRLNPSTGQGMVLQDSLRRPVQTTSADLDRDGDLDFVVCEFGKYKGQLSWQERIGDSLARHTILSRPGAIAAEVIDIDKDGDADVTALFGQADEGIWQFINDGKGHFTPQNLLQFGPANGSSSFRYCDFNQDGRLDLIYTCGDNADFVPVVKAWHGIYVYLNNGKGQYQQSYFYPMPGAYHAEVADFDGDGDVDIAAIAFFPDFGQSKGRFVLLKQEKGRKMAAYTFAQAEQGRWMVLDKGDPDHDGDMDLLLGAMTFEVAGRPEFVAKWKELGIPFIVLENKMK